MVGYVKKDDLIRVVLCYRIKEPELLRTMVRYNHMMDFKKTIFVVRSMIDIMMMKIITSDCVVETCIVETNHHDGATSVEYEKLIRLALKECHIEHLYFVEMPHMSIHVINERNVLLKICNIFLIKKNLKELNKCCHINLFNPQYTYICEPTTFVNFLPQVPKRIYAIPHGRFIELINRQVSDLHSGFLKKNIQRVLQKFKVPSSRLALKRWIFRVPNYLFEWTGHRDGYTLCKLKGDFYKAIDYRVGKWEFLQDSFLLSEQEYSMPKSLLLAVNLPNKWEIHIENQHSEEYYDRINVNLLLKHAKKDECILIKFHPDIYRIFSLSESISYENHLINILHRAGYKKVIGMAKILKNVEFALLPVELFLEQLNVKKIITTMSSTLGNVSSWNNQIICISDTTEDCFSGYNMDGFQNTIMGDIQWYR